MKYSECQPDETNRPECCPEHFQLQLPSRVEDSGHAQRVQGQSTRRQAGTQVDRQVARPITAFGVNEMIGRAYYSPTTVTDRVFSFFLVRAFDLLIAVWMLREFQQILQKVLLKCTSLALNNLVVNYVLIGTLSVHACNMVCLFYIIQCLFVVNLFTTQMMFVKHGEW